MSLGTPKPDELTARRMTGKRVGPHQLIEETWSVTMYGYGSMPYRATETRHSCACGSSISHYSATAQERWLDHVLMDVAEKVYNYVPPQCTCMMRIG